MEEKGRLSVESGKVTKMNNQTLSEKGDEANG